MARVRWFSWLIGISLLAACDEAPRVNRGGDDCQSELVALRVEVVTADGARVSGATITATNLKSNVSITGVTDEYGVSTAVNESLGPSPVRVMANAGSKVSSAERIEWTCDECNCMPEPGTLRLELNP